jgi:glycosyltransferase involved in cell wall biosynthesis
MHDLIVFAEDLGGLPSSTQHLIKRLAQERKVLWINSIGLRQPGLNRRDLARVWHKLRPLFKPNTAAKQHGSYSNTRDNYSNIQGNNITQANLLTIPAPSSRLARRVARDLILHQLNPLIDRLGLKKPLLWSSLPTASDLCPHIENSGIVYYCGDDFSSLAGVDHEVVTCHEQELVDQADLVLVASDKLKKKFPSDKTRLLPHGVDTQLFARPAVRAVDLPQTDGPVAGFYGSLSEWLDFDVIDHSAAALPEWQFVFIGPQCVPAHCLPQRRNIHYLGVRPHHLLPGYSQHWDVSMLPFKKSAQINACNPLKLLEYLAAGQPVVSVEFPALARFQGHVHIARHQGEFVQALLMAANSSGIPPSAVSGQSWDERSKVLNRMLERI